MVFHQHLRLTIDIVRNYANVLKVTFAIDGRCTEHDAEARDLSGINGNSKRLMIQKSKSDYGYPMGKSIGFVFCIPRRLFQDVSTVSSSIPSIATAHVHIHPSILLPHELKVNPANPSDVLVRRRPRTVEASRSSACWVSSS
jgi:hypothetical protein